MNNESTDLLDEYLSHMNLYDLERLESLYTSQVEKHPENQDYKNLLNAIQAVKIRK